MDKNYAGLIWTNHALTRMRERCIKQSDAWAVWNRPEQSRYASSKGAWIYYRTYGKERIEVVAKKNGDGKWVILSVWSKQIFDKNNKENRNEITNRVKESFLIRALRKLFFN